MHYIKADIVSTSDEDLAIRLSLARTSGLRESTAQLLAHDPDPRVRWFLLNNPSTSEAIKSSIDTSDINVYAGSVCLYMWGDESRFDNLDIDSFFADVVESAGAEYRDVSVYSDGDDVHVYVEYTYLMGYSAYVIDTLVAVLESLGFEVDGATED